MSAYPRTPPRPFELLLTVEIYIFNSMLVCSVCMNSELRTQNFLFEIIDINKSISFGAPLLRPNKNRARKSSPEWNDRGAQTHKNDKILALIELLQL